MPTSYPHANTPVNEAEWRQFARLFALSGVVVDVGSELAVSAGGLSLQLTVASGRAFVDGFLYVQTDPATISVGAADPSQSRTDLLVLRYDPDADPEFGEVRLAVVAGTAGAGTAPSPTIDVDGVYEVALAEIVVAAGTATVSQGDVTDRRTFAGSVTSVQSVPIGPYTEPYEDLGSVSGTVQLVLTQSNIWKFTPVGTVDVEWLGLPPAGQAAAVTIVVGSDTQTVNWPANTEFPDGDPPVIVGETWLSGVALSDRVVLAGSFGAVT